jgi:hypothetical protein
VGVSVGVWVGVPVGTRIADCVGMSMDVKAGRRVGGMVVDVERTGNWHIRKIRRMNAKRNNL